MIDIINFVIPAHWLCGESVRQWCKQMINIKLNY